MISTLVNFRLYAEDMARSLDRVAAQPAVERDAAYYAANIGSVDTVDDLMSDRRLYTYALKAHGLSELNDSQALVRKILESDLSDPSSFVNRLSDMRYRSFAGAFDFTSASAERSLQSAAQTDRVIEAYSEHRIRAAGIAAEKASAYEARIASVRSVDEFLADPILFEVAARIGGIDPAIASRDYIRGVLVSTNTTQLDVDDNDGLAWLSQQLNFDGDGKVPTGQRAQSDAGIALTRYRFSIATGNGNSPQAAAARVDYASEKLASIASAKALVDDPILFEVVTTAFGFDPSEETPAFVQSILQSDPQNPPNALSGLPTATAANIARKEKFAALNAAFDFAPTGDGTAGPNGAIPAAALDGLFENYYANVRSETSGDDALATNSYRVRLSRMDTIDDLLRRDIGLGRPVLDYVLKAFDLDPASVSISTVRRVLTSDPSDPKSFVSRLDDPRWSNLAAAFNFGADGKVRAERSVQSVRSQQTIALDYAKSFGETQSEAMKATVRRATERYLETVGSITSLETLLENDIVVDYALKAHGLADAGLSKDTLRRILTSDLADPQSFANASTNPAYAKLAASFNVQPDGRIALSGDAAQRPADVYSTQNLHLLQMLEEQAGQQSEGTRLALYFLRKGPEITTPLSILADKALFEVVRTALNLPVSMSQQDIDRQVKTLESRLDMSDFTDPKKLDRFIARFSALYDMQNGMAQASSPILSLFGSGSNGTVAPGIAGLF